MKESNQICPNLRPFVIPDTNAAWLANIFKETEIFAYISIGQGDCFHMVCEKYSGSFVHNVFEVLTQKDIDIKKKKNWMWGTYDRYIPTTSYSTSRLERHLSSNFLWEYGLDICYLGPLKMGSWRFVPPYIRQSQECDVSNIHCCILLTLYETYTFADLSIGDGDSFNNVWER